MNDVVPSSREPWRGGCSFALAVFIAPVVVVAGWPRGLVLSEEWPFLLLAGLLLALPFGYLTLSGTRDWLPWFVAVCLTIALWGLLLWFGGPGLGAAIISLAIPPAITAAAWASNRDA